MNKIIIAVVIALSACVEPPNPPPTFPNHAILEKCGRPLPAPRAESYAVTGDPNNVIVSVATMDKLVDWFQSITSWASCAQATDAPTIASCVRPAAFPEWGYVPEAPYDANRKFEAYLVNVSVWNTHVDWATDMESWAFCADDTQN